MKKDLERQKDENSETREELQNLTRALLEAKSMNTELLQKLEKQNEGKQNKNI